jgi:hypothetical protein
MATDDEADILIPRRLHSAANHSDPNGKPAGFTIDPAMLERRRKRKKSIFPQACDSSVDAAAWSHIDRALAAKLPAFNDPMWTLGDVARWLVERTPEAVDGLSIDEEKLHEALTEIHDALAKGQITAWSATTHEPVPRELPAATWSTFEFGFEEKNGLLYTFAFRPSGSTDERPLKDLRFKSVEMRRHWPGAEPAPPPPTTMGSQMQCKRWLFSEMSAAPDRPRAKKEVLAEAKMRFPKLSERGFNRAWGDAISETGAQKWSKAGRRSA